MIDLGGLVQTNTVVLEFYYQLNRMLLGVFRREVHVLAEKNQTEFSH